MDKIIPVWKPQGWTPLQAVEKFKKKYTLYKNETVSYAGRLDPMAEGVLVLLVGEVNKKRNFFESFKKTYTVEIAWGITTDTHDPLGMIESTVSLRSLDMDSLKKAVEEYKAHTTQSYPIYSSKTVRGKPLYWWARQGRLSEISIPHRNIEIYSLMIEKTSEVDKYVFCEQVIKKVKRIAGDFRQKEIEKCWKDLKANSKKQTVFITTLSVSGSSGIYMRKMADDLGNSLGVGGIAFNIVRTSVGDFTREACLAIS